jgi:hypothetical protein
MAKDSGNVQCTSRLSQRTFALGVDEAGTQALFILDSHLQDIATVEATAAARQADDGAYDDPILDVAVHGDQVIVLTSDRHPEGSALRLLDLDGRFMRTIAAGQLRKPQAVAASHGRVFVVDQEGEEEEEDEEDARRM